MNNTTAAMDMIRELEILREVREYHREVALLAESRRHVVAYQRAMDVHASKGRGPDSIQVRMARLRRDDAAEMVRTLETALAFVKESGGVTLDDGYFIDVSVLEAA